MFNPIKSQWNNLRLSQLPSRALRCLNYHPSIILILFLLADGFLGWFFYSKYYMAIEAQRVSGSKVVQIDKILLTKISNEWDRREGVLQTLDSKVYPDFFSLGGNRNLSQPATSFDSNSPSTTLPNTTTSNATNTGIR
ncbi:MAG: hypothetical protein PHN39_03225 [Candidatus Pacebacteria bacterium]|nr:hypothetical protein [Candidatus Paceibacterota bacterium]